MPSPQQNRCAFRRALSVVLAQTAVLLFCGRAFAMAPPAAGELEKYKADGSYERRLVFAESLGNNRVASSLIPKLVPGGKTLLLNTNLPASLKGMPSSGQVRPVVLLLDFEGTEHTVSSAVIAGRISGTSGGAYGSLRNYYYNSSYGKLDMSDALVLGWWNVLSARSEIDTTKASREEIIGRALTDMNSFTDFSQYDSDGDGYIDQLIVIWAGDNGGWGDFWWSYSDICVDSALTFDGVRVRNYSWQWEKYAAEDTDFDLMTAIRLTGNSLGLPDYYDYAPGIGPDGGLGGMDIMDSLLPDTPRVDHNALSKLLLGWISPAGYNAGVSAVSMEPAETSSSAVQLMKAGGAQSVFGEYFLVENRRNGLGNDLDLPGSGLAVWHVNSALDTAGSGFVSDNTGTENKLLKLVQADGLGSIEAGLPADSGDFYGTGSHFGPGTTPGSDLYSGLPSSIDIDSVTAAETAVFTLSYNTPPGAVADVSAEEVAGTPFVVRLSWTRPANAAYYEIRYSTIGTPGGSAASWENSSVWTSTKIADSSAETEYISGLTDATRYYFKVKVYNPAGNYVFSNGASVRPWDAPPGSPADIFASPVDSQYFDGLSYVDWTAGGGDGDYGNISVGAYALGVSTYFKTPSEWVRSEAVSTGALHGIEPGGMYAFQYEGLMPDVTYYLALWVQDDAGNWSTEPGIAYAGYCPPDNVPEAPVLAAESLNRAVKLTWTEDARDIDHYVVYRSSFTPYFQEDSSGTIVQHIVCTTTGTTCTYSALQYEINGFRVLAYDRDPFVKFSTSGIVIGQAIDKETPLVQELVSPTHPSESIIYVNNTPSFQWAASDTGGSGLYKIYVTLVSTTAATLVSSDVVSSGIVLESTVTSYSYTTPQEDGDWYFYVVAQDTEQNLSDAVRRKIRIDWYPEPPSTPIVTPASGKISVSWSPSVLQAKDFDHYELYCDSITKGDWSDSFLLAETTATRYEHEDLDVFTTYYYRVRSVDSAPLVLRSTPSASAWARPLGVTEIGGIFSATHPSSSTWYSSNLPSFAWTTIDVEQAGIKNFYILLATFTADKNEVIANGYIQTDYAYTSTAPIADGEWQFQIVAEDNGNTTSAVARYFFRVDASTPVAPAGLYSVPGQNSLMISWDEPYMAHDIASYTLYCDSSAPYDFSDQFFVATVTTTFYLHGGLVNYQPYAYRLTATDRLSHTSEYSGVLNDYAIDGTASVISTLASTNLPVEDTWYPDPDPVYTWSASDSGGSGLRGYYYTLSAQTAMTAEEVYSTGTYTADTTASFTALLDGIWYFYLVAEDNQGNLSLVSRRESRIDYAPGAPRNLNLVPRYRKITLMWDEPAVMPPDFSYYRIYCDSTTPYDFEDGFILARTSDTAYAHLNLVAASTYYYRVTMVDTAPNVLESEYSGSIGARPVSSIDISSIVSPTHPSTSAWYGVSVPSFQWTVEGNGGIGVEAYYLAITTYALSAASVVAGGLELTAASYTAPAALPDGEWTFSLVSKDLLGDYSALAVYPFKIDVSSPPAPSNLIAVSSQNSISLSWSTPVYTYDVDHYQLYCDSVSPFDFADAFLATSTVNTFFLHTGLVNYRPYHYRVYAVDRQGHTGNYADTANNAPLDITPPAMGAIVSASHPDPDVWYENGYPIFNWSATDEGGSGINGYYYMRSSTAELTAEEVMTGGVYTSSAGVILPNVPDGLWYFHALVVDNQGNISGVSQYQFRVDYFPAPPADVTLEKWNGRINLSWTAPDPDPGDIDYYRVYCDSTVPYDFEDSYIAAQTTAAAFGHNNLLATNTYYYRLTTVDRGPNALESVYSGIVSGLPLDSVAPVMLTLASPSHPYPETSYQNNIPTFTWTASDTGGSDVAGYYYMLDQLEAVTTEQLLLTGDFTYLNTTSYMAGVADGIWYFHILPVDYQNNVGDPLTRGIIINMPPAPPTDLVMDTAAAHVMLSWTAPSPLPADLDHYNVYCDSVAPYDFSDGYLAVSTTHTVFIDTITSYGSYIYRVTSVDNGTTALESEPGNTQFLVQTDTMSPVMTSLDSPTHPDTATWYSDNHPHLEFAAYDVGAAGVKGYYVMWSASDTLTQGQLLAGATLAEATYYQQVGELEDGQWYFHAMAVDNIGNLSEPLVFPVRIDTVPPAPATLSATANQNRISLSWTVARMPADFNSFIVYCDSTSADWTHQFAAAETADAAFVHTDLKNYNVYRYRVLIKDVRGNLSQLSETASLYPIDETAPEISTLTATNLPVEDTWYPDPDPVYAWAASDLGDSGLRGYYYVLAATDTMTAEEVYSTGTYTSETEVSFTALPDGIWYFFLIAQDNEGNLSSVFRHATRIDSTPGAPRNLNLVPRYRKITLMWDDPVPMPTDFDYYRIYCDSTPPYDFGDGFVLARTSGTSYTHLNLAAANTYYYRVATVDGAPNVLESEYSGSIGARPVSSIDISSIVSPTHPSTSAWYGVSVPSFQWTVEGNGGIGVGAYYVTLTTYPLSIEAVVAGGLRLTATAYTAPAALPDGEWTFSIVSEDLIGDYSALAVYPFKIDVSSPPAPSNLIAVSSQNSISLSWSTPVYTYDVDHYRLYCDSVSPFDFADAFLATSTVSTFFLHTGLVNYKPYHYRVYAVDRQGHVGNYADTANNAPLDITPPAMGAIVSASHPDPDIWYEDGNPIFNWSATDAGGSGINGYYYMRSSTAGLTAAEVMSGGVYTSSAGVIMTGVPDGLWYFYAMAVDNQGNISDAEAYLFRVDYFPAPPTGVTLEKWNSRINISWTAPDPDPGDIDYYRLYCDSTTPYDFDDSYIVVQTTSTAFGHNNLFATNTYYYRLSAVDKGPNALESVYSDIVSGLPLDSVAPVMLTLVSPSHPYPAVSYQNNIPTFTWTASDTGGAGVAGYYYMLDQLEAMTTEQLLLTGGFTYLNTTSYMAGVADGIWYFHILPVDYQNNAGDLLTRKIILNLPPAPPTGLVMTTAPALAILNWTAPSPFPADFDYYKIYCDSSAPYDFGNAYVAGTTADTVFVDTVTSHLSYKYRVTAVDNGTTPLESEPGNTQFLVQTDTMSPVMASLVSPTHPNSSVWYTDTAPLMEFSAYDNGSAGVKGYYVMWSASDTLTQAQILVGGALLGATYYQLIYGLDDGQWYFHAMAVDNAGNLSVPAVYPVKIDTLPPTPEALSATAGQNEIELSWSISRIPADFNSYIVYCDSTSADWTHQFVATETVDASFIHAGLRNYNVYRYRIQSRDSRGNLSGLSENLSLYPIDALAPEITALISPTHPDEAVWYSSGAPHYAWQAVDTGGSGLKGYYYILDNSETAELDDMIARGTFTIAVSHTEPQALPDSIWYFHLAALDQQENYSAIETFRTNIDSAPAAPLDLTALPLEQAVMLTWSEPDPFPSDFAAYRVYVDSVAPYDWADAFVVQTDTTTFTHWNLDRNATYYYTVRTVDAEPNQMESAASNVVAVRPVEHIAPVLAGLASPTHPDPAAWYSTAAPVFNWTATDEGGSGLAFYSYVISTLAVSDAAVWTSALRVTTAAYSAPAPLADGVWHFYVSAQDGAGNVSSVSVLTFNIDTGAPQASIALSSALPLASGRYGVTLTLADELSPLVAAPALIFTPAGGTGSTVTLTNVSGPVWAGTVAVYAQTPAGTAEFAFSATDSAGNTGTVISSGSSFAVDTSISSSAAGTVLGPDNCAVVIPVGAADRRISVRIDDVSGDSVLDRAVLLAVNFGSMLEISSSVYKEFSATATVTGEAITRFSVPVTVSVAYADSDGDDVVDNTDVPAGNLRLFYLDRALAKWEFVPGQYLDRVEKRVSAPVSHFSTYGLLAVKPGAVAATGIVAYPNPCYLKHTAYITIGGIPASAANALVRIYDQNGALVRTLSEASGEVVTSAAGGKQAQWNGLNSSGDRVASGVYIYLLKADGLKTTGRLGVLW
ncbi:MAG: FlgD immunoglobulin-like domain containing protein [Elusimicrobiaceae bacterium]|nr:FlgD immunoglobulin-like domain containing protein [Elusimicrobiaceae bacterium]